MTNPFLEAALDYAEKGWPVFPCRADKAPMIPKDEGGNGVHDATTDPKQIEIWWRKYPRANIGCNVGAAGLVVLDFDPGSDARELDASIGARPKTAMVQNTPRGGSHEFYELAEGEIISPSSSKLAPHVDVRSFGSYVLLAPSRTPDGEYTWKSEGRAAYRTDEMVRVANSHREKHSDRDRWLIDPDLPENVEAAVEWLETKAKPSVMGSGGDHTAYATAAMMKSYGISEELAFDLMWEHWNPRCSPPWTGDEVEHFEAKIRNGYGYNTSPPGNVTAAYRAAASRAAFKPVGRRGEAGSADLGRSDDGEGIEGGAPGADGDAGEGLECTAGRFTFLNRSGLASIEPPKWLIEDCIPVGAYMLLYGPRSTFKTFVALDMALTVASGATWPWNGAWTPSEAAPVLFALGEGRSGLEQRVSAWEKMHWGRQVPNGNFISVGPVPRAAEDLDPFISGALGFSPTGYALTVIDTLGRSMAGLNENSAEDASKFTLMVERLQRELNTAVLVIAHDAKHNNGATSSVRGSGAFEADADGAIRVERLPGAGRMVKLSQAKEPKDAMPWEKPRVLKLAQVQLDENQTSLAACLPSPDDLKVSSSKGRQDEAEEIACEILSGLIERLLRSNKVKAWSGAELADTLALDERIDVGSSRIRNHYLKLLRESKSSDVRHHYDGATRRWKWIED